MAVVYEGENLKLHSVDRRGKTIFIIRYLDRITKKDVKRQVPKGETPLDWAKKQDIKLSYAGTLDGPASLRLVDVIGEYKAEIDQRVENFVSNAKYGYKLRPNRRKTVFVHIDKHILPALGNRQVGELEPIDIQNFQEELVTRMKPQTVNAVISTLSRMMRFYVRKRLCKSDPCRDIEPLTPAAPEERYTPTYNEVRAVLAAVSDNMTSEVLIRLGAETGMRISEILALRWDAVDNDIIHVSLSNDRGSLGTTKTTGSTRKVMISFELMSMIATLHVVRNPESEFIFTNGEGNLYSASDVLKRVLHRACDRAGVPRFGFHGLRRFYINTQLDAGKSKEHVQKLVGHSIGSHVTDRHYRKIRDEDVLLPDNVVRIH